MAVIAISRETLAELEAPAAAAAPARKTSMQEPPPVEEAPGKPELELKMPSKHMQLDFSAMPGELGWKWAQALQHQQVRIPSITILRVYVGLYGSEKQANGEIFTGGLEQHIKKLDRALAADFPITIHVAHRSKEEGPETTIREPGWRGQVVLHPIGGFGDCAKFDAKRVIELANGLDVDLVHLHSPDHPLGVHLSKMIGDLGFAVTFHSQGGINKALQRNLRKDFKRTLDIFAQHLAAEGVMGGSFEFAKEMCMRLKGLWKRQDIKRVLYDLSVEKSQSRYASAGLVAISESAGVDFEGRPNLVLGVPIDANFFDPARVSEKRKAEVREDLGLNPDDLVLLCHARLSHLKGQDLLPQVMAEVAPRMLRPVKCIIIGPESDPGFRRKLKDEIMHYGMERHVRVFGTATQESIRDTLAVADLCVFPTLQEGLGATAMEALLMKVPVVSHRVGGVPEVVHDGENGILCRPGDIRAFAAAVVKLLRSPELRHEYGENGRAYIAGRYAAESLAHAYMQKVYLPQLLGKGRHKEDYFL